MRNRVRLIAEGVGFKNNYCRIQWFSLFFFGQHKSVGRSLTFRVSAYG